MTEAQEQKEIVAWFVATYPEYAKSIRVSMSGINLGGGRNAAIMINYMKAQGMVKGESDIAILIARGGYGCLVLEHKAEGQTHKLTEDQQDYLDYHTSVGNMAVSTRGVSMATAAIETYMEAA